MQRLRELIRAPFLSPRGFVARALLLAALFAVCEIAGWREHTTFVSGTATSVDSAVGTSVVLGLTYMLAYFGFVLAAPVLVIAALVLSAILRVSPLSRVCPSWTPAKGSSKHAQASDVSQTQTTHRT